jgi:hypothetical protein
MAPSRFEIQPHSCLSPRGRVAYSAGMPHQEPSLRQQLLDARANIQRQINLLRAKPYPFPVTDDGVNFIGENSHLMDTLKGTLKEIEESLAALGWDDTSGT